MANGMAEVWSELEERNKLTKEQVRAEVERNFPYFESLSEDDLKAIVGQAEIGEEMLGVRATTREDLVEAGDRAFKRRTIKDRVCDPKNRKLIEEALTPGNVSTLVALILSALTINFIVAPIVIAIAVLLLKVGLNEYCQDQASGEPATA